MATMRTLWQSAVVAGALFAGCGDNSSGTLSSSETQAVVQMREEEKLARDVYQAVSTFDATFSTIASSEQKHMDAIGNLLERHDIADPVAGHGAGSFSSADLQTLHDQLVAQGSQSRLEALAVGVEIEELDLRDLATSLATSEHDDVTNVFTNLSRGSRNHLRTYYGLLIDSGGSYAPKYLETSSFDSIVNSPIETGSNGF